MGVTQPNTIAVENVLIAHHFLKDVVVHTPLQLNDYLSEKYGAKIYFKREDLQHVRSFKLRGAYYKIKKSKQRPVHQVSSVQVLVTMHKVLPMRAQSWKLKRQSLCRKQHRNKRSIRCGCSAEALWKLCWQEILLMTLRKAHLPIVNRKTAFLSIRSMMQM